MHTHDSAGQRPARTGSAASNRPPDSTGSLDSTGSPDSVRSPASNGLAGGKQHPALAAAVPYLLCPVCSDQVRLLVTHLTCPRGHSFDIARHGYVNLVSGRAGPGTADSADMVAARDRFLGSGYYQPIADATASLAVAHDPGSGLVVDLAGGTGYYLARVLEALPERSGLCVDLSAAALRRAARAHPRAAAIGADVWRPLPLAAGCAAHVLSVFGPRNAAETSRVLMPGGTLIIAAPGGSHLREIRGRLGLIGIDQRKQERIADSFRDYAQVGEIRVRFELELGHADLAALVAMGPSARHLTPADLAERVEALPVPVAVTVDVRVNGWQRRTPGRPRGAHQNLAGDETASRERP